jgi:hypothetical protein
MGGSFIARGERATNLDTKLIILLGSLGAYDGKACIELSGDGSVILLERHIIHYTVSKTLSQLKRIMSLNNNENFLG